MRNINFKTARTSTKLYLLARVLETSQVADRFNQRSCSECAVAIGNQIDGKGERIFMANADKDVFVKRYGVTDREAIGIFFAEYSKFDIPGVRSMSDFSGTTAKQAATAIRALARKYRSQGR